VFENRTLRRIFGLKGDEVTAEWRKLHNEELHYCVPHSTQQKAKITEGVSERRPRFLKDHSGIV
jgi:hypothetical protein